MKTLFIIFFILQSFSTYAFQHSKESLKAAKEANSQLMQNLLFNNREDFEDAQKNFIAPFVNEKFIMQKRQDICTSGQQIFLKQLSNANNKERSDIFEKNQLLNISGLFKVTERIYQIRMHDLSNVTIIEGESGIIIVDPTIAISPANKALELYYKHRPKKTIIAVIYSHNDKDYYDRINDLFYEEEINAKKVTVITPDTIIKNYNNKNDIAEIIPSRIVDKTVHEMQIDGLTFQFLILPNSEESIEMCCYIPQLKALGCGNTTFPANLVKLDKSLSLSKSFQQMIKLWGGKAISIYGRHYWPIWGNEKVIAYLKQQRDLNRYIYDQTIRLFKHGYSIKEIGNIMTLPKSLSEYFLDRGYYSNINDNIKKTTIDYFNQCDDNFFHFHLLPPIEASKRYVDFIGGAKTVLRKAKKAYNNGDYLWVAEVMNHVILAFPYFKAAKTLQDKAIEKLKIQLETNYWKNYYLTFSKVSDDNINQLSDFALTSQNALNKINPDIFFDHLAMRLNGPKAEGENSIFNFYFSDTKKNYVIEITNCTLNYIPDEQADTAAATITLNSSIANEIIFNNKSIFQAICDGKIQIKGDKTKFSNLLKLLDDF